MCMCAVRDKNSTSNKQRSSSCSATRCQHSLWLSSVSVPSPANLRSLRLVVHSNLSTLPKTNDWFLSVSLINTLVFKLLKYESCFHSFKLTQIIKLHAKLRKTQAARLSGENLARYFSVDECRVKWTDDSLYRKWWGCFHFFKDGKLQGRSCINMFCGLWWYSVTPVRFHSTRTSSNCPWY